MGCFMLSRSFNLFKSAQPLPRSFAPIRHGSGLKPTLPLRLFSSFPHSQDYIKLQKKGFEENQVPVKKVTLPKDTLLIGLNKNWVKPYELGATPLFKLESLNSLSDFQRATMIKMSQEHQAKMVKFKLIEDVTCLTSSIGQGAQIHHIHPSKMLVDITSIQSVESTLEAQNTAESASHRPK